MHNYKLDDILSDLGDPTLPPKKKKKARRKRSLTPEFYHRSLSSMKEMNFFINTKVKEYLNCDIKPWKYPKNSQ